MSKTLCTRIRKLAVEWKLRESQVQKIDVHTVVNIEENE